MTDDQFLDILECVVADTPCPEGRVQPDAACSDCYCGRRAIVLVLRGHTTHRSALRAIAEAAQGVGNG